MEEMEEAPVKKGRVKNEENKVMWSFKADTHDFVNYKDDLAAYIEDFYQKCKTGIRPWGDSIFFFGEGNNARWTYKVTGESEDNWIQINQQTLKERKLRRTECVIEEKVEESTEQKLIVTNARAECRIQQLLEENANLKRILEENINQKREWPLQERLPGWAFAQISEYWRTKNVEVKCDH